MNVQKNTHLYTACVCILIGAVIVCGAALLLRAYTLCGFIYPVEASEGICLHMTQLLKQWNLYKDFDSFPLVVANYPPIYFAFNAFISVLFNTIDTYLSGRIISVCAVVGSLCIIYAIASQLFRSVYVSLCCVLIVLVMPWIHISAAIYRVDHLGAFFGLCGVYFSLRSSQRCRYAGALFFLLSLYTKHSLAAAPVAVYLSYAFKQDLRGVLPGILLVICGWVLFLVLSVATDGNFFRHIIGNNMYAFETKRLLWHIKLFVQSTVPFGIIALLVFFDKKSWQTIVPYYVVCGLLTLVMCGREGASSLYFIEAAFAVSIGSGYIINRLMQTSYKRWTLAGSVILIVLLIANNRDIFNGLTIPERRYRESARIVTKLKKVQGAVLAEDPGIGYLLIAGKQVYVHPFSISKMIKLQMLSPDLLHTAITERYFDMVVLNSSLDKLSFATLDRFTKPTLALINTQYAYEQQIMGYHFYSRKE